LTSQKTRNEQLLYFGALILTAGAAFAVYASFLRNSIGIAPWGDTLFLTGPLFCEISRAYDAGALPLINWSTFEAIDYNTHVAPYYPFYFFPFLNFCSLDAAVQAADIIAVFHLMIYFFGSFFLARTCSLNFYASTIAALLATTAKNLFSLAVFPTIIASAAWYPWAVAGLILILNGSACYRGVAVLSLATGAMLTAGPGSNVLSALFFTSAVISVHSFVVMWRDGDTAGIKITLKAFALCGLIIGALVAASSINLFLHIDEIVRWTRTGAVVGNVSSADPAEILVERQAFNSLNQLVLPTGPRLAVGNFYIGPASFLLGLIGLLLPGHTKQMRALSWLAGFSVFIVFLAPGVLVLIWAYLPGLSHVRHLSILGLPLSLAFALLSGFTIQSLLTSTNPGTIQKPIFAVPFLVLAALLAAGWKLTNPPHNILFFVNLLVLCLPATLLFKSHSVRSLALAVLVGANTYLMAANTNFVASHPQVADSKLFVPISDALGWIEKNDSNPGRIAFHPSIEGDGMNYLYAGSLAEYRGMETFHFYMSPRINWKFQAETFLFSPIDAYGLHNGKYVLSIENLGSTNINLIKSFGSIHLFEFKTITPMISSLCGFVPDVTVIESTEPGHKPKLKPEAVPVETGAGTVSSCGKITSTRLMRDRNAVEFELPSGTSRSILFQLPPYSGWALKADGREFPLYAVDELQMISEIPDDVSGQASLIYKPSGYFIRLIISASAWLLLAGAVAFFGLQKWVRRNSAET
jgi:hypothetical protein